jgi:transposase
MLNSIDESSPFKQQVKAVKSVSFHYSASAKLSELFEDFRLMCNDAIRIALNEKPKSRFSLIELAYSRLKSYGLHTHYILSACEVAFSICSNKNRKSYPYVTKAFLKLDIQAYRLDHLLLRIPVAPRHFIFLTLHGSEYHQSIFDDPSLKRGSLTITDRIVSITFSKVMRQVEPVGYMGLDINERNVTMCTTNGYEREFAELGDVVEIKERYREKRSKIGRKTRQDKRTGKHLYAKYGSERGIEQLREYTRSPSR